MVYEAVYLFSVDTYVLEAGVTSSNIGLSLTLARYIGPGVNEGDQS